MKAFEVIWAELASNVEVLTQTQVETGHETATIAPSEFQNGSQQRTDSQLRTVSREVANCMTDRLIPLNPFDDHQLSDLLATLTGGTTNVLAGGTNDNLPPTANNIADPDHDIDFGLGYYDDFVAGERAVASYAVIKQFDVEWDPETGITPSGGMAAGATLPVDGTVHLFLLYDVPFTKFDYAGDTDVNGSNIAADPDIEAAGFMFAKLILSLTTDSLANFNAYFQYGRLVEYADPMQDGAGNWPTSPTALPLTVPTGVTVQAQGYHYVTENTPGSGEKFVIINSKALGPISANSTHWTIRQQVNAGTADIFQSSPFSCWTDTNAEVWNDANDTMGRQVFTWDYLQYVPQVPVEIGDSASS